MDREGRTGELPRKRFGLRSLRVRILGTLGASMVVSFGALLFLLLQQQHSVSTLQTLTMTYVPLLKVSARIDRDHGKAERELERLRRKITSDQSIYAELPPMRTEQFQQNIRIGRTYLTEAIKEANNAEDLARLAKINEHIERIDQQAERWDLEAEAIVRRVGEGNFDLAQGLISKLMTHTDAMGDEIKNVDRIIGGRIATVANSAEEDQLRSLAITIGLGVVAVLLGTLSVAATALTIRPIGRLTERIQRLAEGERVQRLDLRGGDEIATLGFEFDRMTDALNERDQRLIERAEELQRLSNYLRSVLDGLDESLFVVESGTVTIVNRAAETLFGIAIHQTPPPDLGALGHGTHEYRHHGSIYDVRVVPYGTDGSINIITDVTQQIATQQRLAQSERLALIGQMLAQITHEVRNPLNALSLTAELLAEDLEQLDHTRASESWELLATISNEIERLTEVTEHYLQLARRPKANLVTTSLREVIGDIDRLVRPEISACKAELTISCDENIMVAADGNQLRQALLNLIRNAMEAGSQGISLVVEQDATAVSILVSDDGPGLNEEDTQRAFEPFWSSKAQGTGLGLAITRQIVEDHGGTISAAPNMPSGLTIIVKLPVCEDRQIDEE